ncbi:MAG: hypothetical protein JSU94_08855 [Phycisphaerales bacterium]|nr:MAG: hypothetical protein JSU94_08855 [Phycisphaerales bacterium]
MKRHSLATTAPFVLVSVVLCSIAAADQLAGLPDVVMGIVDGNEAMISLKYGGTTYVVANDDLATGTTTRWYIDPTSGLETHWVDGTAAPAATVAGTSNPKVGDQGWKADNYTFRVPSWSNDICSIDGIDFLETVFPFNTDTIFILERGGNDTGTIQAIRPDNTLGPAISISPNNPFADTGINVGGQQAFGLVLTTDSPVKGLRVTASGFDALIICAPKRALATQAHDPNPANGEKGVVVAGATLSWKTGVNPADPNQPNPAITGHNLWLSIAYDPLNPPAAPDWEDPGVLIVPLGSDVDPADGSVDPNASYSPTLKKDSLYYWIVDESLGAAHVKDWDNIIIGDVWTFETETSGPEVDAGDSIVTWLKAGTTTVELNGTVEDSTGDVSVIQWSVLTSPFGATAYIANPAAAATTATLTETGTYVLQLYAKDATLKEDDDAIEIKVYADSCEAAKNGPNAYTAPEFDFNDDCKEDFLDFALFAQKWLEDAALTEDKRYDAGPISVPFVQFTNPANGSVVSGEIIINAIAYDPAVGTNDGDGMEGAGIVRFEIFDSTNAVVGTQNENLATFDMTWDTAAVDAGTSLPVYPNGVYRIRVTAESDAGYVVIKEISVTVNNA